MGVDGLGIDVQDRAGEGFETGSEVGGGFDGDVFHRRAANGNPKMCRLHGPLRVEATAVAETFGSLKAIARVVHLTILGPGREAVSSETESGSYANVTPVEHSTCLPAAYGGSTLEGANVEDDDFARFNCRTWLSDEPARRADQQQAFAWNGAPRRLLLVPHFRQLP